MFRQVPSQPEYYASADGQIMRVKNGTAEIRHQSLIGNGYAAVSHKFARPLYVHQLVCEAWNGQPGTYTTKSGKVRQKTVNHRDGDRTNNDASNLEWTTQSEQIRHSIESGTFRPWKLTEPEVVQIRQLWEDGLKQRDIADRFNVTQGTVSLIVNRKFWQDVA